MNLRADEQKIGLSADAVCSILKACGEAKVRELKFGDLHVVFHRPREAAAIEAPIPPADTEISAEIPKPKDTGIDHLELSILRKEEQISRMMIEDPEAYEKAIHEGTLDVDAPDEVTDAESEDR